MSGSILSGFVPSSDINVISGRIQDKKNPDIRFILSAYYLICNDWFVGELLDAQDGLFNHDERT